MFSIGAWGPASYGTGIKSYLCVFHSELDCNNIVNVGPPKIMIAQ
jgi:hypothetical protein